MAEAATRRLGGGYGVGERKMAEAATRRRIISYTVVFLAASVAGWLILMLLLT